jgi:DNA-directed RNA polymerase specialized sigma subunit
MTVNKRFKEDLINWEKRRKRIYKLWQEGMSFTQISWIEKISSARVGQLIKKVEKAIEKEKHA